MTINFKHNGQENNRPGDQKHIDFQKEFTEKLNNKIEPFKEQINSEPTGNIEVNYVDCKIILPIKVHGFSGDSRAKVLNALRQVYESYE